MADAIAARQPFERSGINWLILKCIRNGMLEEPALSTRSTHSSLSISLVSGNPNVDADVFWSGNADGAKAGACPV